MTKVRGKKITDMIARVVRKGKTRGRPSKHEVAMSSMLSHLLEQNKNIISDVFVDTATEGTGILRIKYKSGHIKMEKMNPSPDQEGGDR